MKTSKQQPPLYWYRIYQGECPVCGRDAGYRERVLDATERRPENKSDRYVLLDAARTYDFCVG